MFAGESVVQDQVNRVQHIRIQPMTFEDGAGEIALQGGEAELIFAIAFQDEADKAIAQSANAVVEDDGVGGLHSMFTAFRRAGEKQQSKIPAPSVQKTERKGRGAHS